MNKEKKKHSVWKWIGIILLVLCLAVGGGFFWYVNDYYHADAIALEAMKGSAKTEVKADEEGWLFDGPGEDSALIFYPGGKVEAQAYAPILLDLANEGLDCYLVKMPFNLAVFGMDKAQKIIDTGDYDHWYMGGHSLGGAMAASFSAKHIDELVGLVLLAAYPPDPLNKEGFKVISLYGSDDHVLNRKKVEETLGNMPDGYELIEIPGGNHCQFGDYGFQKGDGKATISAQEQQEITVKDILSYFQIPNAE